MKKVGPGGFKCPCCNPFGKNQHKAKKNWSRRIRRKARLAARSEVREAA